KPLRLRERQRTQNHGIDEAENRGRGSDAERERDHGHGGEAGVLQQLAEGEFQIVHGSWSVVRCQLPDSALHTPNSAFESGLWKITKSEGQMSKEGRSTSVQIVPARSPALPSSLGFRNSFVIGNSSFVIHASRFTF